MKKIIIWIVVIIILGLSILYYNLSKPNLTLYPKLKGEYVEMYLLKEKFNYEIAKNLLDEDQPFTNITITDGKTSKSAIISIQKLNLIQKGCAVKWNCPVLKMSKEKFSSKFQKSKVKGSKNTLVDKVFESDITKDSN